MSVLVRAVRLIDGVAATPRDTVDVLIEGATIAAVEPHDPARSVGEGVSAGGQRLSRLWMSGSAPCQRTISSVANRP